MLRFVSLPDVPGVLENMVGVHISKVQLEYSMLEARSSAVRFLTKLCDKIHLNCSKTSICCTCVLLVHARNGKNNLLCNELTMYNMHESGPNSEPMLYSR